MSRIYCNTYLISAIPYLQCVFQMFEPSALVLSGHLGPRVSPPACLQPVRQIHARSPSLHVAPSHVLTICPQSPCVTLHHDPRNQNHTSQSSSASTSCRRHRLTTSPSYVMLVSPVSSLETLICTI